MQPPNLNTSLTHSQPKYQRNSITYIKVIINNHVNYLSMAQMHLTQATHHLWINPNYSNYQHKLNFK
eukprot:gene3056-2038_t